MRFRTTILQCGKTTTGFQVPDQIVEALGRGKRPAVTVTINGFTYRNTVAVMDGVYMIGVSAENRAGAGARAGTRSTSTSSSTRHRARWRCPPTSRPRSTPSRTPGGPSMPCRTATSPGTRCRSPAQSPTRRASDGSRNRSQSCRKADPVERDRDQRLPLRVDIYGQPAVVSGNRRRALLEALALKAPNVVPRDRLIDDLWGEKHGARDHVGLAHHHAGFASRDSQATIRPSRRGQPGRAERGRAVISTSADPRRGPRVHP